MHTLVRSPQLSNRCFERIWKVILGFNNLHNRASKSFGEMDIAALAVALETSIGGHGGKASKAEVF